MLVNECNNKSLYHICSVCSKSLGWINPNIVASKATTFLEIQCSKIIGGCGWTGFLDVLSDEVEQCWKEIDKLKVK